MNRRDSPKTLCLLPNAMSRELRQRGLTVFRRKRENVLVESEGAEKTFDICRR